MDKADESEIVQDSHTAESSKHVEMTHNPIFCEAKPVDTASKEKEIEERLEKEMVNKYKYARSRSVTRGSNPLSSLSFITWNIDGLSKNNFHQRTTAVCKKIIEEDADIVFLQEVTHDSAIFFLGNMINYHCLFGNSEDYFVAILLKKASIHYIDFEIIDFLNSTQMRNALKVNVTFHNVQLCLINSHLESTMDKTEERQTQLKTVFESMMSESESKTVIFAGDMNLRDKELSEMGGLPKGIEDMWLLHGKIKNFRYTWDTTVNDNLQLPYTARLRFDRVYVRHSVYPILNSTYFGLIGRDRLDCGSFPSDHFGIVCYFKIL